MTANTAKAIKEIMAVLESYYGCGEHHVYVVARQREKLERALIDFAEGIKLDAIEP